MSKIVAYSCEFGNRGAISRSVRRETSFVLAAYIAWLLILFLLMSSNDKGVRSAADLWMVLLIWGPLLTIATLTAAVWVERRLKRR